MKREKSAFFTSAGEVFPVPLATFVVLLIYYIKGLLDFVLLFVFGFPVWTKDGTFHKSQHGGELVCAVYPGIMGLFAKEFIVQKFMAAI